MKLFLALSLVWLGFFHASFASDEVALPASLTPPSPATPEIHGAKVFGVRPGHPFLFTVAATGNRPMTFSADGLPAGLALNATTGIITGLAPGRGDYPVTLHARNALGTAARPLLIKVGETIALTPPLGWNSWSCFGQSVTEKNIRAEADAMVKTGLINHGWAYINVDGFWQPNLARASTDPTLAGPERNPDGTIRSNLRFPDMKALADDIHSLGLKAGLYSSPGVYTCGGCPGSYGHEEQDAQTYADWGFDYLKYDWCTYAKIYQVDDDGRGVAGLKKPYRVMAAALARQPRDLFFSICQYGMGEVWKWGAETGGNSWRTSNDITDNWRSILANASHQIGLDPYAGPGHWNDPDALMVGQVGWGTWHHETHLIPDEQYTQVSLWALQAAPLLIGGDLTQLDPFTLGLLTNDEVLDVDQDSLGRPARLLPTRSDQIFIQIWARPLEDGSLAVGLINLGDTPNHARLSWRDLGISRPHRVRDLWREKDFGAFPYGVDGTVPAHGVLLLRVSA